MGRKLVLTGTTLTDLTAPKLITVDPIEHDGSLFLFDFTHPAATPIVGVPSGGDSVQNLLAAFGESVVGAAPTAIWERGAGYDGTKGRIERSTKGGLHGVVSPTLADGTTYARIALDATTKAYLIANPTNDMYLSVWGYTTKSPTVPAGGAETAIRAGIFSTTTAASNYLFRLSSSQASRFSTAVGPLLGNKGVLGWTGVVPVSAATTVARIATLPTDVTLNNTDDKRRAQGGFILYRCYLEDLTVSGRTYSEVDAIDLAIYTTEVLTAGGRYYGDTFTDPTTLV